MTVFCTNYWCDPVSTTLFFIFCILNYFPHSLAALNFLTSPPPSLLLKIAPEWKLEKMRSKNIRNPRLADSAQSFG